MDPTLELEVMGDVAGGLKKLSGDIDALRRVLQWASSAFLPDGLPQSVTGTMRAQEAADSFAASGTVEADTRRSFSSLPDLYATVSPASDPARALVVGYWFQVMQGEQDLDGFQINKELKHLGHGVSNITTALSSLIERKPQLVIQTRKSGNSKQARKRYRLTDAGVKAVERMLAGGEI
jgi:predicted RecB family endonuclease